MHFKVLILFILDENAMRIPHLMKERKKERKKEGKKERR
jgi:hypothetical protein